MGFETLYVTCRFTNHTIAVGRLAFVDRKIVFEYSPDFLQQKLEISPFKLPLKSGLFTCEPQIFEGLFGVFNDSIPDGWGKLLLDRKLMMLGINPNTITPLDRLRYVGTRGMGALSYEPEFSENLNFKKKIELDMIADVAFQFQQHDQEEFIDDLLQMNGSSAGARPKILVSINPKTKKIRMTDNNFSHLHDDWIVKFRSSLDPKDIGPIEYAYHLMAMDAQVIVPDAKLFESRNGPGYFGVKRFDRTEKQFLHVHTLSGLLHADHRIPSLDYETVIKVTMLLTRNMDEVEKQFRNVVFNVFAHNRDDHAKNFSFIMNEMGSWSTSPAYDLTFSSGPGGEHCTTVMGNGKNPGIEELLKLAIIAKIPEKKAQLIIAEVKNAVSQWKKFAKEACVSTQSTKNIEKIIQINQ